MDEDELLVSKSKMKTFGEFRFIKEFSKPPTGL